MLLRYLALVNAGGLIKELNPVLIISLFLLLLPFPAANNAFPVYLFLSLLTPSARTRIIREA